MGQLCRWARPIGHVSGPLTLLTFNLIFSSHFYGKLSSTCPSQAQDLFAVQGKQIIRLGAIRLDQDKFYLAKEEKQISLFPNAKRNG